MARSWLSGPDCIYLHNKPAWDGKRAPLSSLTHLDLQNTFCFASSKKRFGVIVWVEVSRFWVQADVGSQAGWRSPGRVGRVVGVCRTPAPTWGIEERWWHMIEAELSLLGLVQSRSHQVFYSHLHQEKSGIPKNMSRNGSGWTSSSSKTSGHIWSVVSGCQILPQLSLLCSQPAVTKPQLNMVCLEGALLSPHLQNRPPHVPGSALSCLLATLAPSKVMLHVIARWFTALFGFSGSWAHVYQQNTHSPVSGFKQIGAIQNAFEQDALHSQA